MPPSGETMRQTAKRFGGAGTCWRSSIAVLSLVGARISPAAGATKNVDFFSVCPSCFVRHAFERQRLCAMKALEYRNDFDAVG